MSTDRFPLDQLHVPDGHPCPFCSGKLHRDGIMDGTRYDDGCSRPWYTCDRCKEGLDGDTLAGLEQESRRLDRLG